jgi:hypothetical protein
VAFADVEVLPRGTVKGLYLRHLRWWMRQPMLTDSGAPTIGYQYPNLLMRENYNSHASPDLTLGLRLGPPNSFDVRSLCRPSTASGRQRVRHLANRSAPVHGFGGLPGQ